MEIATFLDQLASREPAPGGGAVAALHAATALALAQKVSVLSRNEAAAACASHFSAVRSTCLPLIAADGTAFRAVLAAYRLPKSTAEENRRRSATIQARLRDAARVPWQIVDLGHDALPWFLKLQEVAGRQVASDLQVAATCLRAGIDSATAMVATNIAALSADDSESATLIARWSAAQRRLPQLREALDALAGTLGGSA